jgi:magnesium transporter
MLAATMQILTAPDPEIMSRCRTAGEYLWLDLVAPSVETLREVGGLFEWNPLLVEDLEHGGQRPKVEDFADHTFVICYAATEDAEADEIVLLEHGLIVHGDYLVTVRPVESDRFAHLRTSLEEHAEGVSEAAVVHRVLDLLVDTVMEASDTIAADVEQLEEAIDEDASHDLLAGLRDCRRDLVTLRGVAVAQRDALTSLVTALDSIPGFEVGMRSHFRDVADHGRRVVDRLDVSRDLLDAAFEAYYATLAARQGAVTQRLTVIATIFLPLTFVTGFFGQNFTWMVDSVASKEDFLIFGAGTTVLTAVLLALLFRRLKWW